MFVWRIELVDAGDARLEGFAEYVVERAILQHEYNDVLDRFQSSNHGGSFDKMPCIIRAVVFFW